MDLNDKRHWPFAVLLPESRTEPHQIEIGFLDAAYRAGYNPYTFGSQNFGAVAGDRTGEIIYRGCKGKHWEVSLTPAGLSAHLNEFGFAAEAVLRWLGGAKCSDVLTFVSGQFFVDRVTAPGFTLHGQDG
jgi:hypothetical protein